MANEYVARWEIDFLSSLHQIGAKLMTIEDAVLRALDGLEGVDLQASPTLNYVVTQVFRAQDKVAEAFEEYESLVTDARRYVASAQLPRQNAP